MIGNVIQVFLAITIVIVLFAIAFFVYNQEMLRAIRNASNVKQVVPIFTGIIDLASTTGREFNTRDTTHPTYKPINLSVNQAAGAEFTYNFWMYTDLSSDSGSIYPIPTDDSQVSTDTGLSSDDLVLLLKGDNTSYTYKSICGRDKNDVLVKCPLIKYQRGGDVLSVEFNTLAGPEAIREQSRNTCREQSTDWNYMNAHKLAITGLRSGPNSSNFDKKWYMVTVIIQDTNPMDAMPMRNKCRCRILVNGTVELDRYVDGHLGSYGRQASVLRQNMSNLHVAPVISFPDNQTTKTITNDASRKVMMADLTYFNYALDTSVVKNMFESGFNKQFAALIESPSTDPLTGANVDSKSAGSDSRQTLTL